MKRRQVLLGLVALPVVALAHHGWSEYDSAKVLKLTGKIVEYGYEHPHGHVRLETPGKTWLCGEFARRLRAVDTPVAWSRGGMDGTGAPALWPWLDAVGELARRQGAPVDLAAVTGAGDRFSAFQALFDRLRTVCDGRPAVVMIDDLHAGGEDVMLLTQFVARSLHRVPLLVVGAWRSRRPAPGP